MDYVVTGSISTIYYKTLCVIHLKQMGLQSTFEYF